MSAFYKPKLSLEEKFEKSLVAVCAGYKASPSEFLAWLRQDQTSYAACFEAIGGQQLAMLGMGPS